MLQIVFICQAFKVISKKLFYIRNKNKKKIPDNNHKGKLIKKST